MTSCSISNGINRGVYIEQSFYYGHDSYVKESNFTQMKRPLYVLSRRVYIAFSRFHNNLCDQSEEDCVTVQAGAYESLYFQGKRKQSPNINYATVQTVLTFSCLQQMLCKIMPPVR